MNIRHNSKGFSAVEALLIVLILLLLSAAGWYVYSKGQDKNDNVAPTKKSNTSHNNKKTPQSTPEKKLSDEWLLRESSDASIKIPDGFEILVTEGKTLDFAHPGVPKYDQGVKAKVAGEANKHFELGVTAGLNGYWWNRRGAEVKKMQTYTGLDVTVNQFIQENEPDGADFARGTTLLEYTISNGEKFVGIQYAYQGEGIVGIIEEMVKTVTIK